MTAENQSSLHDIYQQFSSDDKVQANILCITISLEGFDLRI